MKLSPFILSATFFFLVAGSVRANTDPPTWLDVTSLPSGPNAVPGCVSDSGPGINNAISLATSPGTVIFFPTGCYLIATQIVDTQQVGGITYLGFGRVELSAGCVGTTCLSGSIIKFGGNNSSTQTVSRRRIEDFYFECNSRSGIDGIDIDGLTNSEFINVEIRDCATFGLRTVGSNANNYKNIFEGGGVATTTLSATGFYLAGGTTNWTFKGTRAAWLGTGSPTGVGFELNGSGNSCLGCDAEGWYTGLAIGVDATDTTDGIDVSGGYFENNVRADIQVGYTSSGAIARGVSIRGAYLHGNSVTSRCIELDQVNGFTISGNEFLNCVTYNVLAVADGTNQGADNGLIDSNSYEGSATNDLLGSNITLITNGQITQINSSSNCSSSANPATCGSEASGSVVIAAGATDVTVDTTTVTASSQILVTFDASLGSRLGVTCNTTFAAPYVETRTAGTSFKIAVPTAPSSHPACFNYTIIN